MDLPLNLDIQQLIVALVAMAIVEGMKRIKQIPVNTGETGKLRIVLGILVLLGNYSNAAIEGKFSDPAFINMMAGSTVSWFLAHYGYKLGLKRFIK